MNAKEFLDEFGWEEAERVATAAGTNRAYFSQIAHGHRRPSTEMAKSLIRASDGRMTMQALRPDIFEAA